MDKQLAMLRACPKEELIDIVLTNGEKEIEEALEENKKINRMYDALYMISNQPEKVKDKYRIETVAELRQSMMHYPKSGLAYIIHKYQTSLRDGQVEAFDIHHIITEGEDIHILDESESKKLWKQTQYSQPTDHIIVNDKDAEELRQLWQTQKDLKAANIPSDIVFAKSIPIMDCLLTQANKPDDPETETHRIIIFSDYETRIDNAKDEPVIIGCITIDEKETTRTIMNPAGQPITYRSSPILIPLLVQRGINGYGIGDIAVKVPAGHNINEFTDHAKENKQSFDLIYDVADHILKIWYGIQIALLHPVVKEIFINPTEEKHEIKEPTRGGKKKTVIHYIKRHVINEKDLKNRIYGTDKKTKNHIVMLWHVTGHWRNYKDGKKVFVKPYWKGPLRELKNAEPRLRTMEIPKTLNNN